MTESLLQNLLQDSCIGLSKDADPLTSDDANELCQVVEGWEINAEGKRIDKSYSFNNYYETMAFVNSVAWIAHHQNHHPDLHVSYNKCKITFSTHSIGGLSRNDFICAARIDQLFK